jgi:adenylosuccinate synthase
MINGVTQLFMMKADVLNIFEKIKICTHYVLEDGTQIDKLSFDLGEKKITPVYTSLKGWYQPLNHVTSYAEFPEELRQYTEFLEKELQVPIRMVSVGPDRKQTILK